MIELTFCTENFRIKGREVWEKLEPLAKGRLRMREAKCVVACAECATEYIVRVNGQLVTAETADDLVKAVLEMGEFIKE